jgi:ABC-type nitrate/sulfonate/bicarbonate transport system permease component
VTAVRAVGKPLLNFAVAVAVVVVLWVLLLRLADLSELVTRQPQDVWRYLVTDPKAGANRHDVLVPLWHTLLDAGIGFVVGMLAATVLATGMVLSKGVEAASMPVVMLVRTVPLVALAPIITLVFGNGLATVAVMSGIVVLFPALVTIAYGLRSVTPQMRDVVHVYGGSSFDVLRRVAYPTALPSVFAAVRISVPGAITGALIAEFFTTTDSVGKAVNTSLALYQYDQLWALVVVVTLASIVLYMLAQACERLVLARFGQSGR